MHNRITYCAHSKLYGLTPSTDEFKLHLIDQPPTKGTFLMYTEQKARQLGLAAAIAAICAEADRLARTEQKVR